MRRVLPWLLLLATGSFAAFLLRDGARVAALAGRFEIAARTAQRDAERAAARQHGLDEKLRLAEGRAAALEREVARLTSEVDEALSQEHAIGEALTAQVEAMEQGATERASTAAMASLPPPTGVQRCLQLLRECLVADGFRGLRFVSARVLQDQVLGDVEMLDVDPDKPVSELVVAGRMTAALDRAAGSLTLRFFDGWRRLAGVRTPLPAEGFELRLHPVTGRMWEHRLPFLVRAAGEYAAEPGAAAAQPRLDAGTRMLWVERLDGLLARAGTPLRLRLGGFRTLQDHRFVDARLLGYDQNRLLRLTADCRDLAVEIDERAAVVSLLLRDGSLRQPGGASTISADGYRMLLEHVTPQQASDAMLGMVVRK